MLVVIDTLFVSGLLSMKWILLISCCILHHGFEAVGSPIPVVDPYGMAYIFAYK